MTGSGLPPLSWLRAFEAAARHLSFTRAAQELNLTQSAISQHVRNLESYLGHALFIRRTRALELTEAGANYLPTIREAFDLLAAGTRAFTGGDRGQSVVVQCNLAFSAFWLTPRLKRLMERHPWLSLDIVTPVFDPERSAGAAAMEIRFCRASDIAGMAERLTQERYYPVCHPDFAGGQPDWHASPLFDCSGVVGNWEAWAGSQGESLPEGRRISLASTYVISLNAAIHGAGLAMAHDMLARDLIEAGRLIRPYDHAPDMAESYFLLAPARYGETPASRAFKDWIDEEMAAFTAGR